MNTGTQAAKEAGNMVDLDSQPDQADRDRRDRQADADDARRADDVQHRQRRRQVLRDHPGGVRGTYPVLDALNVMRLATPQSAILSAVIFNALIIVALIPLALRGVAVPRRSARRRCCATTCWSTASAASIVPFIGIKVIDMILVALGLA